MIEPAPVESPKRGTFYKIRVTVLLLILGGVLLYAWSDWRRRHGRNEWKRPLLVAFIVVREGPVTKDAVVALDARVPALEARLEAEMHRYDPTGPSPPFNVTIFGPIDGADAPPTPPSEPGLVATPLYQFHLNRWVSKVDALGGLPTRGFDSRIYLYARPPESSNHKAIEGASELGGTVGVVRVELDETMADLTLFVATHEMFHTLGATDKYAPDGSIDIPDGLAEPDLQPPYPQRFAELMARHRPLSATTTKPPATLAELAIGAKTAREVGWTK